MNVLGALVTGAGWILLGLVALLAGYAMAGPGNLPSWLMSSAAFPMLVTVPALVLTGRLLRGL